MLDGVGEDVAIVLIHHFVGVMVGVVDMGVAVMLSADTASPWRVALPNSRKTRQEKRTTKTDITSILWLRGSLRNFVGLPRKFEFDRFGDLLKGIYL